MRLYETADGRIVGTQAEAGRGYSRIDVPTDKAGLIDYLNALKSGRKGAATHGELPTATQQPPAAAAVPDAPRTVAMTHPPTQIVWTSASGTSTEAQARRSRALAKLQAGEDADHFCAQVLEAPPFVIARVFEALAERVR